MDGTYLPTRSTDTKLAAAASNEIFTEDPANASKTTMAETPKQKTPTMAAQPASTSTAMKHIDIDKNKNKIKMDDVSIFSSAAFSAAAALVSFSFAIPSTSLEWDPRNFCAGRLFLSTYPN